MTPKWAVQFVIEIGLDHAKFEGDNSSIVAALANSDTNLALHGNVIEDATISSNVTINGTNSPMSNDKKTRQPIYNLAKKASKELKRISKLVNTFPGDLFIYFQSKLLGKNKVKS